MAGKKKFKMIDAILLVICVVFVAEAAAPVAAIGNSQYFWWLLLMIIFLLPYGLISSELGTTYDGEGGLYDWVRKAFGSRMGSRVAWYYWINYPLWLASLSFLIPELVTIVTGIEMNTMLSTILALAFVWLIVVVSLFPVCDSSWILNGAALIKVGLALLIGGLGVYVAMTQGVANEITPSSLLPTFDLNSLGYISVILFNMLGFEVICTLSDEMEDPNKQIPKAIVIGGLVIAGIYMFSAFGIGAAIPTEDISSSSGLVDAIAMLTGDAGGILVKISAVLFGLTLVGNMLSWALGVNNVACYSAQNGDMPKVFAIKSKKNDMPKGAALMNGLVASFIVIIAPFIPNEDLFWSFFALNLVTFLLSYIPMFPAFLRLRKIDPDTERPFKVKGSKGFLTVLAIVPMIVIIIALIFTAVPLSFDAETLNATLPITIGSIIAIIIGEIIARKKRQPIEKGE